MRPVYVCQLPDEMQREIRGILADNVDLSAGRR